MNWSILYDMQRELDTYIERSQHVGDVNLFEAKYVALLVELGELANETRCFKFWSNKQPSDGKVILEEYVDGLHFILSLGIEKDIFFDSGLSAPSEQPTSLTTAFSSVFEACTSFKSEITHKTYNRMVRSFLHLGGMLGFTEKEMEDAYRQKNQVNYDRQQEGY